MNVYDFTVKTIKGEDKSMSDYKNKVLIVVNTAGKCGFTPQYEELEALYRKYKDKGLEILGFPSNQFAEQEPDSNEQIAEACKLNYGVSFQLFAKGDIRGETAHPFFKYLVSKQGFKGFDEKHPIAKPLTNALKKNFSNFLEGDDIKWNFTKFVINRQGEVIARFEPTTTPSEMEEFVASLL